MRESTLYVDAIEQTRDVRGPKDVVLGRLLNISLYTFLNVSLCKRRIFMCFRFAVVERAQRSGGPFAGACAAGSRRQQC